MKSIEEQVKAYKAKLIERQGQPPPPKPSPAEKVQRLQEQLTKTEASLEKADQRRIKLLLRAAKNLADQGDYAAVYGYAVEIVQLCRVRTLGVREAYPVSIAPPPRISELPASFIEEEP